MKIKKGTTRLVFVFSKIVFKFPIFWSGATVFYMGLLSNCKERNYYKNTKNRLVAKCFYNFYGFLTINERCYELSNSEYQKVNINLFSRFNDVCKNNLMKNKYSEIVLVDFA